MKIFLFALALVSGVLAKEDVIYREDFNDGKWEERWIKSEHKSDFGDFKATAGKYFKDENDLGIKTTQDARFYALSSKFDKPFDNDGKDLVLQFQVKHEQNIDCGGGYIKLFPADFEPKQLHGDTKYYVMFGPDICGPGTRKVHVIFNYKGSNLLTKKDIRCKDDELSHAYTLIVKSDNTYKVLIDNEKVESGTLEADWDFLAPKKIKDPDAKKPDDWDEREMIDDESDTKPEDWDKPQHIADPDAKKPEDWDDEMDGEWEPPQIDNPEYKGEWKPKQIKNPDYKGKWEHPEIDNPEYKADDKLYHFSDVGGVGFDLWQVKAGTIFDNILVTDDEELAASEFTDKIKPVMDAEQELKEKADEEDRKKREEEEKKRKEEDDKEKDKKEEEEDIKLDDEEDAEPTDEEDGDSKKDEL